MSEQQQAKLYKHTRGLSLELWIDNYPPDVQDVLRPHLRHDTFGDYTAFGWRVINCRDCDAELWRAT
ncbi:hypothetical protein ACIODS_12305 [Micromonospora chalcea]|uniref:hypothetical protein n=1 Tax=Micromonospora chalcea TaxID=1874 RepID=UPI003802B1B6